METLPLYRVSTNDSVIRIVEKDGISQYSIIADFLIEGIDCFDMRSGKKH
jgi:hypothetical protein